MNRNYFTAPVIVAACLAAAAAIAVAWLGSVQPLHLAALGAIPAAAIGLAVILSRLFRLDRLVAAWMFAPARDPEAIITVLVKYADVAHREGLAKLPRSVPPDEDPLVRRGVLLAASGIPADRIRDELDADLETILIHRPGGRRALASLIRIGPLVGLFGLVLCTTVLLITGGPAVARASNSMTLYVVLSGSLLMTLMLGPAFESLVRHDAADILARTIIAEGVAAIRVKQHPRAVETRLRAMIPVPGAEDTPHSLAA
jgi:flagellar motor component MotA